MFESLTRECVSMWVGWLIRIWLYGVISRPTAIKHACLFCVFLNTSCSIRFAIQTPTNLWHQNPIIICSSLHITNLFPHWIRIPKQLSFKSSSRFISFSNKNSNLHLSRTYQPKTIVPLLSNHSRLTPLAIFQILPPRLTSRYTWSQLCLLNNQLVLWENCKNLIFHINPIQTAVKKNFPIIFSKTSWFCYIKLVNFVTYLIYNCEQKPLKK